MTTADSSAICKRAPAPHRADRGPLHSPQESEAACTQHSSVAGGSSSGGRADDAPLRVHLGIFEQPTAEEIASMNTFQRWNCYFVLRPDGALVRLWDAALMVVLFLTMAVQAQVSEGERRSGCAWLAEFGLSP